jgi:hypothetical protein
MARQISMSEADLAVLGPLAEHRLLTGPQVAVLLGVSADAAGRRLRRLADKGLVAYQPPFRGAPASARITRPGVRAVGRQLSPPGENLNEFQHDVGVGWLWLAARAGAFGEVRQIATERTMQAADGAAAAAGRRPRYGVGLGMLGPNGRPQRHYPDLMLDLASGHRVAVELELTQKSSRRLSRIMTAYASDASVDAVLYLTATKTLADRVTEAARRAGIGDIVHVQRLAPGGIAGAPTASVRRARTRASVSRSRSGASRTGVGASRELER